MACLRVCVINYQQLWGASLGGRVGNTRVCVCMIRVLCGDDVQLQSGQHHFVYTVPRGSFVVPCQVSGASKLLHGSVCVTQQCVCEVAHTFAQVSLWMFGATLLSRSRPAFLTHAAYSLFVMGR